MGSSSWSLLPSSIYVARLNRFVERIFNVKGGPAVLDIDPTVHFEVQFKSGTEDRYLQGWERFAVNLSVTGGAAQTGAIQLRNPLGSNVLAVVEKVMITALTVADTPTLQRSGPNTADLTTVVGLTNNRVPDSRGRSTPTLIASTSTNATGTGLSMARASLAINANYDYIVGEDQELPLLPDNAISIISNTAAAQLMTSWWWRERGLETSELTP